MRRVQEGDTIRVLYIGKIEDGTVFDSSFGERPLEFTVGEGEVVHGFEQGVLGMAPGESKSIMVPMEQGYGPRSEDRMRNLDKRKVPEDMQLHIGQRLRMYRADGLPVMGTVIGIDEAAYLMDYNHPLAGKTLIFETTLLEIF
jgi:peptidylprolyl isomerase